MHSYTADASRNRFEDGELKLSSIFKWYRGDFEEGWRGADSLHGFIALYAKPLNVPASAVQKLKSEDIDIDFLDYDWRLNVGFSSQRGATYARAIYGKVNAWFVIPARTSNQLMLNMIQRYGCSIPKAIRCYA